MDRKWISVGNKKIIYPNLSFTRRMTDENPEEQNEQFPLEELDRIYDNAMKKILTEISDSVGGTMPKEIRQKSVNIAEKFEVDRWEINTKEIETKLLSKLPKRD